MTILSPESLLNLLDLIESGASVVEASAAIGAAPKSKIAFKWLADSAEAGEFGQRPDPSSPWCLTRGGRLEWFHVFYAEATEHGRQTRAMRSPLRADLEERLAAKRASAAPPVEYKPPRLVVEHVTQAPVILDSPPPPKKERPSYAYKAPPTIEGEHGEDGPPSEGRFSMVADKPKTVAQRRAGTVEITETGVRQW